MGVAAGCSFLLQGSSVQQSACGVQQQEYQGRRAEQQVQQSTAKLGEEEQPGAAGPSRIGSWGSSRVQ